MAFNQERRSLLSSSARVQVPWIKVTIGNYTFGVYSLAKKRLKDDDGFYYTEAQVQYPSYIQSLNIIKINGKVNQYTLNIKYPIRQTDDPNFFEKVFSSVSKTRKIIFSYGDMSMPSYIYRNEEAIITNVTSSFEMTGSAIDYTVSAVTSAALDSAGSWTFAGGFKKPSDEIKRIFKDKRYGLSDLFTGMSNSNLSDLIAGDDKFVDISAKVNISAIDYIIYLVSCMLPAGFTVGQFTSSDIYVLTMHDDATYDESNTGGKRIAGSYFRVERVSYKTNKSDAFQIDLGFGNTGTIVTNFRVEDNENYALLYDYNEKLEQEKYVQRLNNKGEWETIFAPTITSKNDDFITRASDISWWTKITKFPIKASITIQGLLRPAILMNYVRLNVIFPGGRKHIASGLYLITKQQDSISESGYRTTLSLTKIAGDTSVTTY